jgi:membrane protein
MSRLGEVGVTSAGDPLARLPARLQPAARWLMARWPGRILLRSLAGFVRIEIFDRSMAVAAQFFTSVFPILIIVAVVFGGVEKVAEAIDMPDKSRTVIEDAFSSDTGSSFGIIGVLVVLISATSLSRALTRAFAAIWLLPRPRSQIALAWRWLAAVITLAMSIVLVRVLTQVTDQVPPADFWTIIAGLALVTSMAVFVPWVLLAGQVSARRLLPGAFIFGIVVVIVRPVTSALLPVALDNSSARYGAVGIAFTYITWLYLLAFAFLGAAVIGHVVATDEAWLGRLVRGESAGRNERAGTSDDQSRIAGPG